MDAPNNPALQAQLERTREIALRRRIEARLDEPRPASDFMARLLAINELSSSATKRQVDLFGGTRKDPK